MIKLKNISKSNLNASVCGKELVIKVGEEVTFTITYNDLKQFPLSLASMVSFSTDDEVIKSELLKKGFKFYAEDSEDEEDLDEDSDEGDETPDSDEGEGDSEDTEGESDEEGEDSEDTDTESDKD